MNCIQSVNALSGLYLISTKLPYLNEEGLKAIVSMPSRAYTSFLRKMLKYADNDFNLGVNALSGLYLISTVPPSKI